jgi:hypothetical protein
VHTVLAISLAYPQCGKGWGILLAQGDYYLPSWRPEEGERGDISLWHKLQMADLITETRKL